ncbi:MAG: hypothetical protein UHK60_01925 [Acutalibacteraceae bacterium]|nr:hypothetical protein [Acutalibacteraceae bacterium]MEE1280999.1 hypothetical protein [Acutalibacteraceae bacterium]
MNEFSLPFFTIFFIIIIIALIIISILKIKNKKSNFDERQELVRGKAYKYAFFSMAIYGAIYLLCSMFIEKEFLTASMALIIDMFIGLVVSGVYSIWNEAFFTLNIKQSPKAYIVLLIWVTLLNSYTGISAIIDGNIIENGTLSTASISLIGSISLTIILITILIKFIVNKKAEHKG